MAVGELWWYHFGHPLKWRLGNCGGITLVIPTCRLSASTLQDVCFCLVNPLPSVVIPI